MVAAITGGIASGKTTVLAWFAQWGAFEVSLDRIAHALSQPEKPLWQAIVAEFGKGYLLPTGELDRKQLAQAVFANVALRRRLNRVAHPLILQVMEEEVQAVLRQHPDAIVMVEVPLLVECALYWRFDRVILVDTEERLQQARLKTAGLTEEQIHRRLQAQLGLRVKRIFADWVVWNGGSLEHTRQQSWQVWQELVQESTNPQLQKG